MVLSAILLVYVLPATTQSGSSVQIFGPKQYVRTTGAPNQYTDTIAVPAWVVSPYKLHIQNGDPSGSNRVSSATITVNGTQVAGPSDFNQNVAALDRTVTLTAQTTLHVTLASKPGSYLILNLAGAGADHAAPVIAVTTPANGQAIRTATPAIGVTYSDPAGAGGSGASGVNLATLAVTLDGADRTSLFTRRSADASATLPPALALAPGPHTLVATVSDNAGNPASATSRFTVDLAVPQIQVVAPAAGSYLATATPTIHVTYQDDTALDLATLKVLVNGVDRTALFTKTATGATWTPTSATALPQGANQITAQIADSAGNLAGDAAAFNVDSTPPGVIIAAPAAAARFGDANVPIAISYRDDQAVDPSSLQVRLDGNLLGLTVNPDGATGTATGVADGSHTLVARILDRAGNPGSATVTFVVATAVPTIQVTAPPAGAFVSTASPRITVTYSDPDAVAPATFKLRWNGTDITNLFTAGATEASADLAGRLTFPEGTVTLTAQISNLAGVTGTATSVFTVDTRPPTVSITAPAGAVASGTPAASITYADGGSGIDTTAVHVLLDGADATRFFAITASKAVGTLEVSPPLADGPHTLEVTVADRAENPATASSSFVVDATAPVAAFVTPVDNSFLNTPTPSLRLTYGDGSGSGVDLATLHVFLSQGSAAETEITSLFAIGADQAAGQIPSASPLTDATYHLRATLQDRAGNGVTARSTFEIDRLAPTYQIVQPAESAALQTGTPAIVVSYQDERSGVDPSKLALRIDGVDKSSLLVAGAAGATATLDAANALADGPHTIEVTVVDRAGNPAPVVPRSFTVDLAAPTIVQLDAPAQLPPGGTATVSAVVVDNLSIASVVFQVNGATVATVTAAPYQFVLTVPADARSGDTLTVTAVASDVAGNSASASRGVSVAAAGVVVGRVLADATGLPLPGATVEVMGGAQQDVSDDDGRYSLPVSGSHLVLRIERPAAPSAQLPALLPVEREVSVQSGVGTVPVDARLTAVAAPVSIGASGGTLTAADVTVAVPAGAVGEATAFHLTRLSAQGLSALLPLGWSPIVAFDLRVDAAAGPTAPLGASFVHLPTGRPLQLVAYDSSLHSWTLVAAGLTSADGTLAASLPSPGGYALVVADETTPPLPIPEPGQPLTGVAMVALPLDAASSGSLSPVSLSPAGGTALATLAVQSSFPLPSGTVIQADVTEAYTLTSGEPLSAPARAEDLILYGFPAPAGATLAATFPVTPSRSFEVSELATGKVHLDILSGRESVRGGTGGRGAVVVQDGGATLSVAAGSLPEDTAIDLGAEPLAAFLPSGSGLTPLAQYAVDLGGQVLVHPAQLSAPAGAAQPGDTLLLARIERFGGVARLVVVSLAQVSGGQMVSQAYPGLSGITQGGEYVFYRSVAPVGFVAGRTLANGGPVSALVTTGSLPFVTLSNAAGQYLIPAAAGPASLRATVPQTALLGTGSATVTAGQTAALDLALAGALTAATVDPVDGALGVDPSAVITILAPAALNPTTVTAANVQLFEVAGGADSTVAVRLVLAQGNRQISVFPLAALKPAIRYRLQVSGLATAVGGLVAVPSVTFTTRSSTPPNFNPDALVFAFPDADGNVAVSAPAGSFPPGTRILVVDQTNGVVISLTVRNDGSISGELPATIDDVLLVTLTAPDGTSTSFNRTQFVAPDGTVAVGASGGTVTGPGGVELRIPAGALDRGVRLKIEAFGPNLFPERPDVPNGSFGSGLKVSSPDKLAFKKELKLAFPKPADAPDGSFFYVYRRLATADGKVAFETIDHAFVEGQGSAAKVVTASAPFPGFITGMGALLNNPATSGLAANLEDNYFYLEWSNDRLLPGIASQGVMVGKVRRTVPPGPGQADPTYTGIGGAMVYLSDDNQIGGGGTIPGAVAISQADGTFSIWDRRLGGGTRKVTAVVGGETVEATAVEVDAAQPDPLYFPNVEIYRQYRNLGKVNLNFAPLNPPQPAPQVDVRLFTLDTNGLRVPATGVLQSGSSLVIAFKSPLTVTGATVGGVPQNVTRPDVPENSQDPLRFDSRVVGTYTVGPPGVYTVVATALSPFGGPAVTATRSFLAVGAGGNNGSPTPGTPPTVVQTSPLDNSVSVATTTFPQVTFSEPVTGLTGNVRLTDSSGHDAALRLLGVRPDGSVVNPVGAGDAVTALTVQPTTGLKFGEAYTLTLGAGIADQNQPPLHLSPFSLRFTTFGPQELGGTEPFSSTRPFVLGQRAYFGKYVNTSISGLGIVDISDPSHPVEVPNSALFIGRAIDAAGVEMSPVTRGPLAAVAAGVGALPLPSNVWIYDVSNPDVPNRVAAVSATTSAGQDGTLLRIAMKGGSIYASTFPKGIQVIDVQQAVDDYRDRIDFGHAITTEGQGFATDAVVNTIPLTMSQGRVATMYDLKAGDFATAPPDPNNPTASVPTETLVVATGRLPLVVVNPLQAGPNAVLYPSLDGTGLSAAPFQSADGRFRLELGHALALGSLQRTDAAGSSSSLPVALVVGTGSANGASGTWLLAVVDLTDPRHPAPLGFLALPEFAGDVALKDSVALIGTGSGRIRLVNLTDPAHPSDAGEIVGAFGDRLAITDTGIVVTTSTNGAIGGVHTATLNTVAQITGVTPQINLDESGKTTQPIEVEYQFVGNTENLSSGIIDILENGQVVKSFAVSNVSPGKHKVAIPAGVQFDQSPRTVEVSVVRPDGTTTSPFVTRLDALDSDPPAAEPVVTAAAARSLEKADVVTNGYIPIDSLVPSRVPPGSGDTAFTAFGIGLASLTSVSVAGLDGSFADLPATPVPPDEISFVIPGRYFAQPGFLRVSTSGDSSGAVLLSVPDPTLPALDTASDFAAVSLDTAQSDVAGPPLITVYGTRLVQGMKLVLGQGSLPTAALPTTLAADGGLQAVFPVWAQVEDSSVFVAVLATDGKTLSNALLLPVTVLGETEEPSGPLDRDYPLNPAAAFEPGDIELTGAGRNPNSATPAEEVLSQVVLQGVGLADGAIVQFKTVSKGATVIETSVLKDVTDVSTSAVLGDFKQGTPKPPLKSGKADVPPKIKKRTERVARIQGLAADGQVATQSLPQEVTAGALFIPFGGRVKVGIYESSDHPGQLSVMTLIEHDKSPDPARLSLRKDLTPVFQGRDGGRPLAQIEKEPGESEEGYFHLRGVSLSQVPSEQNIRPTGQLVVNGKVLRDVYVFFVNFGSDLTWNDKEIARVSNRHGLPPDFLKAQAAQESDDFKYNFRYEPSTKDFNELTGDASSNWINSRPFCFYAVGGRYLGKTQPKTDLPPFPYKVPGQTIFPLGASPIKRRNGGVIFGKKSQSWKTPGREELQPAVLAQIEQAGHAVVPLTLVRSQALWRKVGTAANGHADGELEQALCLPGELESCLSPLMKPDEFSVDYDRGIVTLGAPLQPGQSLHVTHFWPLAGAGGTVSAGRFISSGTASDTVCPGQFISSGPAPDLNSSVKQQIPVRYDTAHGQSLADWLTQNIALHPNGNFLSGTDSDSQIEFKVSGGKPVSPLDPKYASVTAQPYAASSYGVLQLTLAAWGDPNRRILDEVFNIRFPDHPKWPFRSIFELLVAKDPNTHTTKDVNGVDVALKNGLDLGAAYSEASYLQANTKKTLLCRPDDTTKLCSEALWRRQWAKIFSQYNLKGEFYKPRTTVGQAVGKGTCGEKVQAGDWLSILSGKACNYIPR